MKKLVDKRIVRVYHETPAEREEDTIADRSIIFIVIFGPLALQMLFGYFQVRQYQKAVRSWLGKGVLGIGQRRGFLKPGEILILVYDRNEDRALAVSSMRGFTVFAHFKEIPELCGLSLAELRRRGIELDGRELGWYRRRHPYDPELLTKKKGALIQAVEAVDRYLRRKAAEKEAEEEEAADDGGEDRMESLAKAVEAEKS
ncbi:MAG: transcriptional regulator GutM [Treponema sp.]|jgi:glucitol operon activator protein|nr:transcriptional regulator GutM [Treponema sp.]